MCSSDLGDFKVAPSTTSAPAAELDLHTVLVTTAVGKDPGIKAPQAEPEPSVPHAVKDPLRFLGKEPGAGPAEEPEETEEEEETPAPVEKTEKPEKPAPKPK